MLNFMTEFKTKDDSLMFMHTGNYLLHNNGWNILCLGEPLLMAFSMAEVKPTCINDLDFISATFDYHIEVHILLYIDT